MTMDSDMDILCEYQFSPLDEIMPPLFNGLILCFPCRTENRDSLISTLKTALTALYHDNPFLAGNISRNKSSEWSPEGLRPGHLSLQPPSKPIEADIVVNDLTLPGTEWGYTYEDLMATGMPTSKLDGKILAPLAGIGTVSRVMAIQVNFIPGGLLLSICVSHSITDAYGIYLIVANLARHCRQAQASIAEVKLNGEKHGIPYRFSGSPPPSLTPSIAMSEYNSRKLRPELWRVLGLDWRRKEDAPKEAPYTSVSSTITRTFNISAASQAAIKRLATPSASGFPPGNRKAWISTNDALVAFLWTSIMKARFPSGPAPGQKTTSYVSVAINGRKALDVPPEYAGNVVFCSMTELPISALIARESGDDALAAVALSIRKNIETNKDPVLLRDAVALASCIPDVRALSNAFRSWFGEDLVTTSWVDLPFYDVDFGPIFGVGKQGGGKTDAFRMPKGQFVGICSIQPRQLDGSADFIVSMRYEEIVRLQSDPLFAAHAKFVAE